MDPHQANLSKSFNELRRIDRPRDKYFCEKCNVSFSHSEQFALHNRMHDDINCCYTCGSIMQESGCICKKCLSAYSRKGFAEHKRMPEQNMYATNGVHMVAENSYRPENNYMPTEQAYDMSLPHKNMQDATSEQRDESPAPVATETDVAEEAENDMKPLKQEGDEEQNAPEPEVPDTPTVQMENVSGLTSEYGMLGDFDLPEPAIIPEIDDPDVRSKYEGYKPRKPDPTTKGRRLPKIIKFRVPNQCIKCKHVFDSPEDLAEHKAGPICVQYVCDVCDKVFTKKNGYNRHVTVHSEAKPYKCKMCAARFKRFEQLKKHHRRHSGERPYKCDTCGMSFSLSTNLKIHNRTHTGEKPYSCTQCGKEFKQKSHLNTHIKMHLGLKPFVCETCGKAFAEKASLVKHTRVHTGEKPYKCKVCSKCFACASYVNKHMRKEHVALYMRLKAERKFNPWRKPFVPKNLPTKLLGKKKRRGKKRAGGEKIKRVPPISKPYPCDVCGITLSQKSYLTSHMRIHSGEKPYACNTCDKKFTQKSHLNTHMKIHTGIKPFKCDTCDKAFFEKAGLIKHTRIHTGERPYPCEICDKRFRCTSSLAKHRKKGHTAESLKAPQQPPPEKKFKCQVCNKAYAAKPSLSKHMRVHTEAFMQGNNEPAPQAHNANIINNSHPNSTSTPTPPVTTPITMDQNLARSLPPPPIQNYNPYPTMCPPQAAYTVTHDNQGNPTQLPPGPQFRPAYYPPGVNPTLPTANYGPVCYPGVDQWTGFQ